MKKRFVLCIDNRDYEASLIPRKFTKSSLTTKQSRMILCA